MLMEPVGLPQKPLHPVAYHRIAQPLAGDDGILPQGSLRLNSPVRYEVARDKALSVLLEVLKITLNFQDTIMRQSKAGPL